MKWLTGKIYLLVIANVMILLPALQAYATWPKLDWGGSFSITVDKSLISARETVLVSITLRSVKQDSFYVGLDSWSYFAALGDSIRVVRVDSGKPQTVQMSVCLRAEYVPISQVEYSVDIGVARGDPRTSEYAIKNKTIAFMEKKSVRVTIRDPDDWLNQGTILWQKIAVAEAAFLDIVFHPSGAWVATARGLIYKSFTQGRSWERVESMPFLEEPHSSVICCHPSGVILLSYHEGIARSTDIGETWSHISITNKDYGVMRFFVATDGSIFALGETYRSTDVGLTWVKADRGIQHISTMTMLELPDGRLLTSGYPHPVYVVKKPNSGLYESNDQGRHWHETEIKQTVISSLGSSDGSFIYASSREGGFWKSTDGGQKWNIVRPPVEPARVHEKLIVNNYGDIFALGFKDGGGDVGRDFTIFSLSTDQGETWSYAFQGMQKKRGVLAVVLAPDGHLLATTYDREVYRSLAPFCKPR